MAEFRYEQFRDLMNSKTVSNADKGKLINKYPDFFRMYSQASLAKEGKLPGQAEKNIKQQPKQSTPKAQVKPNAMEQRMTKEGLTKAATKGASVGSKAKNIIKGTAKAGAKAVGGLIAGALDLPTTVHNWMDEGANTLSRSLDAAGTALTTASPYALKIPGWKGKVAGATMLGLGQGAHILSDKVRSDNVSQQPLVKQLTPEEQERYNQYVINQADNTLSQANNQIQQTKDAIDWYNAFDNRMSNEYNKLNQDIANYNMSLPAAPRTGLNYNSGTSNPPSNLTPINKPPTSANNNQPITTNQGNNQMVNQQPTNTQPTNNDMANLMNNIQMLNSYIGGVQRGNVLPNLGVSNEELQAYSNALRQYGENVSRARADVEAYRDALNRSNKMQSVANLADAIGNFVSTAVAPRQNMYFTNQYGQFVGTGAPERVRDSWGTGLRNAADRQLQNVQTNLALNNQLRQQEENRAAQFADLLTAARVSNATGLPLNVTRQMTPENYLNYISPIQEAQNRAQELAIEGTQDLITNRQQQLADYARALDVQALQNSGQLSNQQLQQLGQYQRELLSQNAANQRAQLDALVQTRVAELNNNTKLKLMQMTGMNAQELEKLRQSDPNAYLRAVGNVLIATTISTDPNAIGLSSTIFGQLNRQLGNGQTVNNNQQQPQGQNRRRAILDWWQNYNK